MCFSWRNKKHIFTQISGAKIVCFIVDANLDEFEDAALLPHPEEERARELEKEKHKKLAEDLKVFIAFCGSEHLISRYCVLPQKHALL